MEKMQPKLQGVLSCALGAFLASSLVWHKVSLASTVVFFGFFCVLVLSFLRHGKPVAFSCEGATQP